MFPWFLTLSLLTGSTWGVEQPEEVRLLIDHSGWESDKEKSEIVEHCSLNMDPMEHCLSPYQPQPSESSKEVLERLLENHDPNDDLITPTDQELEAGGKGSDAKSTASTTYSWLEFPVTNSESNIASMKTVTDEHIIDCLCWELHTHTVLGLYVAFTLCLVVLFFIAVHKM
ncbi:hypothetical protein PCASD_00379 [Puccinia coronata f. sp. avenae]|nr:hypothetical protein PCASD_05243 [Puccinia coronata f. sp. avenae]PLW51395.1 hypothetical protein PCASD_00379 [Puccinia coronata f. sp. avenae]